MKIELHMITVRELTEGYADNDEAGVRAYGGRLDVRPPYQREFVYNDKQRDAVIDTLVQGFPLNVMYWAVRDDGTYEIIDGQQRTLSICQYINGDFAHLFRYFHNLADDEQTHLLDYPLQVYFCSEWRAPQPLCGWGARVGRPLLPWHHGLHRGFYLPLCDTLMFMIRLPDLTTTTPVR